MKRILITVTLLFAILIGCWILFRGSRYYPYFQHSFVTEQTTFRLPKRDVEIEHSRVGIHPMMAEYDRWLTLIVDDRRGTKHELAVDTCGGYPINCYITNTSRGEFLYLHDAVSEHLIDIANDSVKEINRWNEASPISDVNNRRGDLQIEFFDENSADSKSSDASFMKEIDDPSKRVFIGKLDGKTGQLNFTPATLAGEAKLN